MARILATNSDSAVRDLKQAIDLAERTAELPDHQNPVILDNYRVHHSDITKEVVGHPEHASCYIFCPRIVLMRTRLDASGKIHTLTSRTITTVPTWSH